jgi:hypothetical protein
MVEINNSLPRQPPASARVLQMLEHMLEIAAFVVS